MRGTFAIETKEQFFEVLGGLICDIIADCKKPDRIPKTRVKSEQRAVIMLSKACGISLTQEDVDNLLFF